MLKQWFLRITKYQNELLDDLDLLTGRWPERVLSMQKHWIGKSTGAQVRFIVQSTNKQMDLQSAPVDVFTTRLDTLFGVQYLALSLDHPIVRTVAASDSELQAFVEQAANLPPDSKAGY